MANKQWMQPSNEPPPEGFFVVPFDARFPNQNQTRNCYQNYLDYHRCHHKYGEDHAPCEYFQKVFKSICPKEWVEKWDDQRAEGKFPGNLTGSGR